MEEADAICPGNLSPPHIFASWHRFITHSLLKPIFNLLIRRDGLGIGEDTLIGFFLTVAVDDEIVENFHPDKTGLL
jgi:hypothetical protein